MVEIFADDIYYCIFINENHGNLTKISFEFVAKGPIDMWSALVQVMAWCRSGDKPLLEPMMTDTTDAYLHHFKLQWVNCGG